MTDPTPYVGRNQRKPITWPLRQIISSEPWPFEVNGHRVDLPCHRLICGHVVSIPDGYSATYARRCRSCDRGLPPDFDPKMGGRADD